MGQYQTPGSFSTGTIEVKDLDTLNSQFTGGALTHLPQHIVVGELLYEFLGGSDGTFDVMLKGGSKGYIVYRIVTNNANSSAMNKVHTNADNAGNDNPQDRLVFMWAFNRLRLLPVKTLFIAKHRMTNLVREGATDINGQRVELDNKMVVGDECELQLVGFNNNNPITAKVDTGAEQCSLHGEDVKFSDELVEFTFENTRYRMHLADTQTVRSSDGGDEKRPCVTFNIKLGDQRLEGIKFNINERSNMPHQILIGQNLLEQGRFVVDPNIDKEDTTEGLEAELAAIAVIVEAEEFEWPDELSPIIEDLSPADFNRILREYIKQQDD